MRIFKHLILTIALFFALKEYFLLENNILFSSLILTILIDVYDHLQNILLNKKKYFLNLLKKNSLIESYKKYFNEKENIFTKPHLHTPFIFILSILLAILFQSFILFIGVVFHFFCDITDYYLKRKI